mmetsp:Transcript_9927/g.37445  ORF Transcript_9927/g.37445 Transcript_9927/m.37445 type:complete len:105 (+) Transcript_9927:1719-2033(+)
MTPHRVLPKQSAGNLSVLRTTIQGGDSTECLEELPLCVEHPNLPNSVDETAQNGATGLREFLSFLRSFWRFQGACKVHDSSGQRNSDACGCGSLLCQDVVFALR